jgi:hypothetical protein
MNPTIGAKIKMQLIEKTVIFLLLNKKLLTEKSSTNEEI